MKKRIDKKGSTTLFGLLILGVIILLLVIFTLPSILSFIVEIQGSTATNIALFEIEHTDSNSVIITHTKGQNVNQDKIRIDIDGEKSPVQFTDTVKQGDSIRITEKKDSIEFVGNERIDVVIIDDDSSYIIRTKRLTEKK
jgi:competence protein ComGC